jgi:MFS family permease
VRTILSRPALRQLLAVRLAGQFGDGVFQASLAGAVLFNPERQAHAADLATGFAVLLVPYSVVGPFAGVLLDRWWRQRVLTWSNVARAAVVAIVAAEVATGWTGVGFYATALVAISLSRFVLSALSASLPHVVADAELVTANALTTTAGSIATVVGGGAAVGVRAVIGDRNGQYALIACAAVVVYLVAGSLARRFGRTDLGPDDVERAQRQSAQDVARGLVAGARHVRTTPPVASGLAVMTVHRLGYGLIIVCTVLLYRNHFHDDGVFRAGLAGLTQVIALLGVGGALAAFVTPTAFRRAGPRAWIGTTLVAGGVLQAVLLLPYRLPVMTAGALLIGFVAQAVKISVDTLVQHHVADAFRGRVFSIYDMLVNLTLVLASVITAAALPEDGHSPVTVLAIGAAYVLAAAGYARVSAATPTTA